MLIILNFNEKVFIIYLIFLNLKIIINLNKKVLIILI